MDKILSLLYLTLILWWFFTFILKFRYQKKISHFLAILFFVSFLFNAISLNLYWFGDINYLVVKSMYWATLHLGLGCIYGFILEHLAAIPSKKKLNIISKILLLSLFVGMTKPLLDFQAVIVLFNLSILLVLTFKFKNLFRLTFGYLLASLCLLVTYIVLKMIGYDLLIIQIMALSFMKVVVDHFNMASLGES